LRKPLAAARKDTETSIKRRELPQGKRHQIKRKSTPTDTQNETKNHILTLHTRKKKQTSTTGTPTIGKTNHKKRGTQAEPKEESCQGLPNRIGSVADCHEWRGGRRVGTGDDFAEKRCWEERAAARQRGGLRKRARVDEVRRRLGSASQSWGGTGEATGSAAYATPG